MPFVIQIHEYRGEEISRVKEPIPLYVQSFDADAFDGGGELISTSSKKNAKKFENVEKALSYWNTQSTVKPLREDGRPNKPLTAFTVSIVPTE